MVMIKRLYPEVIKICRPLIIEDEVLKLCAKKFQQFVEKSLTMEQTENWSIKCSPTYIVDFPDGSERGSAFGLDISGKVFRMVHANFRGDRIYELSTRLYEIPEGKLKGNGFRVIEYIARCVANFVETTIDVANSERIILGVSIRFPIEQDSLQDAKLISWDKDIQCDDFIRQDFFTQLKLALKKYKATKNLFLIAATRDSASCLLAGLYKDPTTRIGLTVGDRINVSYLERQENVPIYPGDGIRTRAAFNLDISCFGDDGCLDFIKSEFDQQIESAAENQGTRTLDKLISGEYMGELFRLCLLRLISDRIILSGTLKPKLKVVGALQSSDIAFIEGENEKCFNRCRLMLQKFGYNDVTDEDCLQVRFVARCIARRSANLLASFLAAMLRHLESKEIRICTDGYLIKTYMGYKSYLEKKLDKLKPSQTKYIMSVNDREDLAMGAGMLAHIYKDGVIRVEEKYRVLPPIRFSGKIMNGMPCSDCEVKSSVSDSDSGLVSVEG